MDKKVKKIIREVLRPLKYQEIYLFGSRARGDHSAASDYDLLVVLKESLPKQEKMRLCAIGRQALAELGIDGDIVIKSFEEIEYYRDKVGHVVRQALKEGVAL